MLSSVTDVLQGRLVSSKRPSWFIVLAYLSSEYDAKKYAHKEGGKVLL